MTVSVITYLQFNSSKYINTVHEYVVMEIIQIPNLSFLPSARYQVKKEIYKRTRKRDNPEKEK